MAYGSGRVAGNWGQEPRVLVLSAATAMILPWLMILCAHECLWCRCQSFLPSAASLRSERRTPFLDVLESRRDEDPPWVGAARPQWIRSAGRRECGFTPHRKG